MRVFYDNKTNAMVTEFDENDKDLDAEVLKRLIEFQEKAYLMNIDKEKIERYYKHEIALIHEKGEYSVKDTNAIAGMINQTMGTINKIIPLIDGGTDNENTI